MTKRIPKTPSNVLRPTALTQVTGGRRVDFTEAYINEVKLPSTDSK